MAQLSITYHYRQEVQTVNPPHNGFVSNRVLILNVGFLLNESIGIGHEVPFDVPELIVADDLCLAYLRGLLRLSRTSEGVLVQGQLKTGLEAECGRCLNPIPIPLDLELEELFAQNPNGESQFYIGEDGLLNLAPLLREETFLAIPMAPVCQLNADKTCPFGYSLDDLAQYVRQDDDIDPRLAVLLQLRDQDHDPG